MIIIKNVYIGIQRDEIFFFSHLKLYLQVGLLGELRGLGISEIIIREGRVQRRYQVEQCLPVDGITQDRQAVATLVLWTRAARECPAAAVGRCWEGIAAVAVCGRWQGLDSTWATSTGEFFVLLLLGADHFAGIAFNP